MTITVKEKMSGQFPANSVWFLPLKPWLCALIGWNPPYYKHTLPKTRPPLGNGVKSQFDGREEVHGDKLGPKWQHGHL